VGVGCSCIARPIAHLQFLYRWRCTPKSDPVESYYFVVSMLLIVQKFILINLYCQTFFIKPELAIARLRLHASMSSMMSICLSVCLSVAKMQKTRFSQKLSNLELWCLLTTYRKLCKLNWAFQRTHYI